METKRAKRNIITTDIPFSRFPLCKYGSLCYQKNPEHHKKYRHTCKNLDEIQNECTTSASPKISPKPRSKQSTLQKNNSTELSIQIKPKLKNAKGTECNLQDEITEKSVKREFMESVEDVLNSMPQDFFDFWDFCATINKSKPQDAFAELGIHLVGTYDLLSYKLPKKQNVFLHCHWRYFYDPPEFQTVVKFDGEDLYHIGYFRDDPAEKPMILASNCAASGPKMNVKGDNMFAALHSELTTITKKLKDKVVKSKFSKIMEKLQAFSEKKKYSLLAQSPKVKDRNKKVVAKTLNDIGIVVPVVKDIGYRPLPQSNATILSLLKRIVKVEDLNRRLDVEEDLDKIITLVQFATDECDYGMGLELGIDLFSFGDPYFHKNVLHLLTVAYGLLKRPKYGEIIKCHLANRRNSDDLDDLFKSK